MGSICAPEKQELGRDDQEGALGQRDDCRNGPLGRLPDVLGGCVSCSECVGPDLRTANIKVVPTMGSSSPEAEDEIEPIQCSDANFAAMGVVPPGWRVVKDKAPEGFSSLGGSACVIERLGGEEGGGDGGGEDGATAGGGGGGGERRILLAMPDWAVDIGVARRLVPLTTGPTGRGRLCRLWRVACVGTFNTVVFEFDAPQGEPLSRWLQRCGHLKEDLAVDLYRSLLQLVVELQGLRLCLWGLLNTTMTYVDSFAAFASMLPVGCLLSFHGARCAAMSMTNRSKEFCLTPEMERAILSTDRLLLKDPAARSATDTYAVAALVFRAMTRRGPGVPAGGDSASLSDEALDLLHKALYQDHAWRLTPQLALVHRWLKPYGPNAAL